GIDLTYAWDLDGDGAFDDSTLAQPSREYTSGPVTVGLKVTDANGLEATTFVTIRIGVPPEVTIAEPAAGTTWAVGDTIEFSGSAQPASTLHWKLILRHCARTDPSACHTHRLQEFDGPSGSFVAPDHEYPSHLELSLTAAAGGLSTTKTVDLYPRTADITLASAPPGMTLTVGGDTARAPFTVPVIARSLLALAAPSAQELDGVPYAWASWSDGLARVHTATAPDGGSATYTAAYAGPTPTPSPSPSPTATPIATVRPPRPVPPPHPPAPAPQPTATPEPPPGPIAAWSFDRASRRHARDASGRHRTVRLRGAKRAKGRYGRGLSIGRGDRVSVRAPRVRRALTVEAWVAPRRRRGSIAFAGRSWALYPGSARVGARRARGRAPQRRHWTHLALTYDGRTIRRYVDGEKAGARRRHGRLPSSPKRLRFGRGFNGRIDEVRIYDRALTRAEIRADLRAPIS
ncbi:MAG TPA: LamG domain-containing protein, partial [Solirubrobacter sp.]|nr:LamG domain-containing protein [Solirubrobacter sp.]